MADTAGAHIIPQRAEAGTVSALELLADGGQSYPGKTISVRTINERHSGNSGSGIQILEFQTATGVNTIGGTSRGAQYNSVIAQ